MKNSVKLFLLLVGLLSVSQLFAQHGRYSRRYNDRYAYNRYAYNYRPYYSPLRTSVSIVARLPFGAVAVTLGSRHYHYYDGLYYAPYASGYTIVEPPMGVIVPMLPPSAVYMIVGGRPYYRYQSVYYMPVDGSRYQVVPEPKEEVEQTQKPVINNNSVSDGYEKFVLEGKTYYKKGTKYYKAGVNSNGEIVYEEVGETSN